MDIDKRKLIAAVYLFPCLWKTTDRDYKDLKAREHAWKEVASQVRSPFKLGSSTYRSVFESLDRQQRTAFYTSLPLNHWLDRGFFELGNN